MTSTKFTLVAVGLAAILLVAGTAAAIPSQAADQARAQNGAGDHPADASQYAGDDDAADEGADSAGDAEEAPANETDDGADDEPSPERERERNRTQTQDRRMADGSDDARGPPGDMPAQAPDHVTRIHETIRSFLAGDIDGSLGQAIAGFMPAEGGQGNGPSSGGQPAGAGR